MEECNIAGGCNTAQNYSQFSVYFMDRTVKRRENMLEETRGPDAAMDRRWESNPGRYEMHPLHVSRVVNQRATPGAFETPS